MKVLVTGASGFIGREIVAELLKENLAVVGLKKSGRLPDNGESSAEFYNADITDYKNLKRLENISDIEIIIHSAGLAHQFGDTKKAEFDAVNVSGTENVLKLAVKLRVKHFILIGTTAVYGIKENHQMIDEDVPLEPQTLYAESKLEAEKICQRVCEENSIALTVFRLSPVIGENNVGNVARLIEAIDKNRFLWIGKGDNLKTFIYKRDVARACLTLIKNKKNGTEIFNLAAEPIKLKTFVNEIALRLNKRILPIYIPEIFFSSMFQLNAKILKIKKASKLSETVKKWLSDDVYSAERIAETYQFKPETDVLEAVRRQVDFYRNSPSK